MHTYVSVNCVIGMSLTVHCLSYSYLMFLQRVLVGMVDMACIDWRLYGMHLGFKGQRDSDRFRDRFCCFD